MEHEPQDSRPGLNFAKWVGETALGIAAVYIGLKIGESIMDWDMPFYAEIGVATAVGAAPTNIGHFHNS